MKRITAFPKKWFLNALSIYKYLFSFLTILCFFVLPSVKPRLYFLNSQFIDFLARSVLCLYLIFAYWSVSTDIANRINKSKDFYDLRKNSYTFISMMVSAIGLGAMVGFLARWSLLLFVAWMPNKAINVIAILNGLLYSMVVFALYFTLPDDE